jgi:hypothetical protein
MVVHFSVRLAVLSVHIRGDQPFMRRRQLTATIEPCDSFTVAVLHLGGVSEFLYWQF